ncbi:hypothetical protein H9L39_12354 [Fusarium oxysporum f. sp. albedinis]|nr:hypothetical protein H9L39_12354 [Fusarium oxysporum f. sp. albedinis]
MEAYNRALWKTGSDHGPAVSRVSDLFRAIKANTAHLSPFTAFAFKFETMARVQCLLALLASTHLAIAQNGSHFKMIPVYPSPPMTGKNDDFKLTLEEKSSLVDGTDGPCGGNIAPIPRLSFKGICLQDSPLGVREANFVTTFPPGITAGASFDRAMIRERGLLMAEEFRAKGINIAW